MNQNVCYASTSRLDCNTPCTYIYKYIRVYAHICICMYTYVSKGIVV